MWLSWIAWLQVKWVDTEREAKSSLGKRCASPPWGPNSWRFSWKIRLSSRRPRVADDTTWSHKCNQFCFSSIAFRRNVGKCQHPTRSMRWLKMEKFLWDAWLQGMQLALCSLTNGDGVLFEAQEHLYPCTAWATNVAGVWLGSGGAGMCRSWFGHVWTTDLKL